MIPTTSHSFEFSKPALAIILASGLLAIILTASTIRNVSREQNLLENFLLQEGLALIRSFEAGARTTMRHHMAGGNLLQTLVEETVQEESLLYVRIIKDNGEIVAEAGKLPPAVSNEELHQIVKAQKPFTSFIAEENTFEVSRLFEALPPLRPGRHRKRPMMRLQMLSKLQKEYLIQRPQVIMVGLSTREFVRAQREDREHAWLMGAILFLLGSAGLYYLFLYQSNRVTRSTLANMRLYTENVIESMPAGLISLDGSGHVVSINKVAEKLLDGSQETLHKLIVEGTATRSDQDIIFPGKNGSEIPIKLSISPLKNHKGEATGQVLILQDMRDIRKIEQQLELSRRLASLGRMAAGIAHEIRNPLGTLRGFAQYFAGKEREESDGKKYADLMVSEVDRLNASVSALLQFARAPEPRYREIDLNLLFAKLEELIVPDCKTADLAFTWQVASDTVLYGDPDLLLQVLLNILQNALKMTDAGGNIRMSGYQENDSVVLEIADTGYGIAKEVQEKIFDPFYSTRKDGTGLGLAISHQIVEQHHGRIEVESTVGVGTSIKVIL